MRAALAGALILAASAAAQASTIRDHDNRYAMVQDVVKAMRCAPPRHCRQGRPVVHKRRHKAVAHRWPVVRYSGRRHAPVRARAIALTGVVPPLAAKAREIVGTCGSRVISAVRHTFVAGTRLISLHASGRAVDVAGNPGCIYALLHGWPGGVSIDYGRVRHVHVSYDPVGRREWHARFAHGGHHHSVNLYARRHLHRRWHQGRG